MEGSRKRRTACAAILGLSLATIGSGQLVGCLDRTEGNGTVHEIRPPRHQLENLDPDRTDEASTLRLLIWEGYAPDEYVHRFEDLVRQKYGRNVTLDVRNAQYPDDFYSAVRAGDADLITIGVEFFKDYRYRFIQNELLLPLNLDNVPNARYLEENLRNLDQVTEIGEVFGMPLCRGVHGLVYNADLVNNPPTSWSIFWQSDYSGRYSISASQYDFNVPVAALATGYTAADATSFDALNNDEFRSRLRYWARNAASFWVAVDEAEDLQGNLIGTSWGDSLATLRTQGENWQMADPVEGVFAWVDCWAVTWTLKNDPFLKIVAEEWINYLLAPDYQVNTILRKFSLPPTTTNIDELLTEEERLERAQLSEIIENVYYLPSLSERDRNGLRLLWDEAMQGIPIEVD